MNRNLTRTVCSVLALLGAVSLSGCGSTTITATSSAQEGLQSIHALSTPSEITSEMKWLKTKQKKAEFSSCVYHAVSLNEQDNSERNSGALTKREIYTCELAANFIGKFHSDFEQAQFNACIDKVFSNQSASGQMDSHLSVHAVRNCRTAAQVLNSAAVSAVAGEIPNQEDRADFYRCVLGVIIENQNDTLSILRGYVLSAATLRSCYSDAISYFEANTVYTAYSNNTFSNSSGKSDDETQLVISLLKIQHLESKSVSGINNANNRKGNKKVGEGRKGSNKEHRRS